ncbi:copper resistance CopC/CopD family protein [Streptomyces sp. DH37]|uniref:copper resistance CopC/CopD family protein n=1 Tax=Streptomyces sp. DH37 TaxID=3040122 RepID=UPI002442C6E3|nr:copper resistance protein CopC [Streptomyces sp. DH37]MDG9701201.1 copper resistance protein CopC [Streptomyces sp. DH37]
MTTAAPRIHRTVRAALPAVVLAVLAALCLLGGATPAGAHAALTASTPARGAVVEEAPSEVTLTFTEGIAVSDDSIRVLAPDGERVDAGAPKRLPGGEGFRYGVELRRDGLPEGTYTVAWKAVSADSHPVAGGFTFSVGAPSETTVAVPAQEAGGGLVGALYATARWTAYAGFLLLVGGAAFVLACWPGAARVRPVQRLVVAGWVALTAATIAALLLRGPYTGSGRLGDAFDADGIRAVLGTGPGTALVSRLLLLAVAALFVSVLLGTYARRNTDGTDTGTGTGTAPGGEQAQRDRRDLVFGLSVGGAVVAAGLAATWATAEHASTGIQTGVAIPVHIVHLLAAAGWLGGLAVLLTALWRGPSVPREAVARFSRLALGCVAVLAATGLYQSWRQVGGWQALTSTPYGRLLLAKVALVALMIGVARASRRWTARLADAAPGEREEPGEPGGGARRTDGGDGAAGTEDTAGRKASARVAAGSGPAPDPAGVPTPERAAQLARQRAAADAARRRRERDADPVRAGLRRSVLAEAAVAVAVLTVTTVLTGTEPARTAEAAARAGTASTGQPAAGGEPVSLVSPFDTGGPEGKGSVHLDIDPGRSGDNTLHLRVTDPRGRTLDVPEVKVSFTLEAQDIGPLDATLEKASAGHWTASGLQLPMSGTWKAAVTVRTSDIDQTTERMTFHLP